MTRVPIYTEIKRAILEEIDKGRYPEGARLTPEVELAGRFGVSRPTVRQAILELAREGVVARRRGRGTVVLPRRPETKQKFTSGGSSRLTELVIDLLSTIETASTEPLDRAAEALLRSIAHDRLIHVGGTGHGLALVLEAFYRPGGLANVNPVWDPALLAFNGARQSTALERQPGLGRSLADKAGIRPQDSLVVFSQSGVNPVPVELAVRGRELGATTIAITSITHSQSVPSRDAEGRRLMDVAEIVIDTHVPAGDASFLRGPDSPALAPLSTLAGAHAWNLLLVRLAERADVVGTELPIWVSSNVAGGDARVRALSETYGPRIPSL
jgi:uncharacterized phosphosugar-binding protein